MNIKRAVLALFGLAVFGLGMNGGDAEVKSGSLLWAKRFGGTGADRALAVAIDKSGRIVVGGDFEGKFLLGKTHIRARAQDGYIAVFSSAGQPQWVKSFGVYKRDVVNDVAVTPHGDIAFVGTFSGGHIDLEGTKLFAPGRFNSNVVVGQYSPAGTLRWAKHFGEKSSDAGKTIAVFRNGDLAIAGLANRPTNFGGGPMKQGGLFLVRLSKTGVFRWFKQGDASAESVAADINGNVWITGDFQETFSLGGKTFQARDGEHGPISTYFAGKVSSKGQHLWSHAARAENPGKGTDIVTDVKGNAIIAGYRQDEGGGNRHAYLLKVSGKGKTLWQRGITGSGGSVIHSVAASNGHIVATGHFDGTVQIGRYRLKSAGKFDVFVVRYTSDGKLVSAGSYGGQGVDMGMGIAIAPGGGVVLVGNYENTFKIGGTTLQAAGKRSDVFVASFAP